MLEALLALRDSCGVAITKLCYARLVAPTRLRDGSSVHITLLIHRGGMEAKSLLTQVGRVTITFLNHFTVIEAGTALINVGSILPTVGSILMDLKRVAQVALANIHGLLAIFLGCPAIQAVNSFNGQHSVQLFGRLA